MVAWILALLAMLLALMLGASGLRMRAARERWERRFEDALHAARTLQEQLDAQHDKAVMGALAGDIGGSLQTRAVGQPVPDSRRNERSAEALLAHYRRLVNDYDHAVQYCLQPVDLIAGADNAGVEQLLRHVTEARRRLFSTRTELMQSPVPARLTELFAAIPGPAARRVPDVGAALGRMATGSSDMARHMPADVNGLLAAALILTDARLEQKVPIIKRLEALPELGPAPWLGPLLLQLLQGAAAVCGPGGRLIARTVALPRRIEVHIIGHTLAGADDAARAAAQRDAGARVLELQQQIDRYGASLVEMDGHGHGLGVVLRLPVRTAAAAA